MDVDNLVEKLLETVLRLFRDVSYTGYEFVISPSSLAYSVVSSSGNRLGPLTFFVFSVTAYFVGLKIVITMLKGTSIPVPIYPLFEEWFKATSNFEPKALLKAAGPYLLIVAVHAAFVKASFDVFGLNISYESVFSTGCYAGGTVYLIFAVGGAGYILILPRMLPRFRRGAYSALLKLAKPELWMLLLIVPTWLISFKSVHSYFVLLSAFTGTSIWRTIGYWFGGTVGFLLAALALLAWFWPVIFPDFSTEKKEP